MSKRSRSTNSIKATGCQLELWLVRLINTLRGVVAFICTIMFVYQTGQILDDVRKQPYSSKVNLLHSDSIRIPDIKICPSSWINMSLVQQWNISNSLLEYLLGVFSEPMLPTVVYTDAEMDLYDNEYEAFFSGRKDQFNGSPKNFFETLSIGCDGVFSECKIGSRHVNCCEHIEVYFENIGLCYLIKDNNFRQQLAGPSNGLFIRMKQHMNNSLDDEIINNRMIGDGVYVFVSGAFAPYVVNPVFVPFDHRGFISFSKVRVTSISDCQDRYPKPILLPPDCQYDQSCCIFDCVLNMSIRSCQCGHFAFNVTLPPDVPYCTPRGYNTCYRQFMRDLESEYTECKAANSDTCKRKCTDTLIKTGKTIVPIDVEVSKLLDLPRNESSDLTVTDIYIYMESIVYELVQEYQTQTAETLISKAGGLLGLWLGLSIVGVGQLGLGFLQQTATLKLTNRKVRKAQAEQSKYFDKTKTLDDTSTKF